MARRSFREGPEGEPLLDYDLDIAKLIAARRIKLSSWIGWLMFRRLARRRPTLLLRGALSDLITAEIAGRMRRVAPGFILTHSLEDPYNTDHPYAARVTLECRMIAQAWGPNPGEKVLGAPQLYLFEPHQTEQCDWRPDTILDITDVWAQKRAAIECMEGQEHLWDYYTDVARRRGVQARRNSGPNLGLVADTRAEAYMRMYLQVARELS